MDGACVRQVARSGNRHLRRVANDAAVIQIAKAINDSNIFSGNSTRIFHFACGNQLGHVTLTSNGVFIN
ncbi:hypothetical protein SB6422_00181 [Klebsiella huaxiensis]|uniref:Uncharacterized protein n=1 Tax=Klebsiella huaxiensis TaxID=2153354 RepID=A0A564GMP3_9ENTR|nr:hypothetical protein SB6422_00181 [Klebsiella huaxiensis]